jgi:glyoxylase-like metal-dependent hydrolase (beta-lactamase superfamily II)
MITSSIPVAEDLHLIPLSVPLPGFENFVSAWLYLGQPRFLVDVGPASTAETLFECLERLGVTDLDYILLTHIHLDHAGAAGQVAAKYGNAPIVCHAAAIPNLVEPERLWEGTKKVLGKTALGYGPIRPVAANRLVDAAEFSDTTIKALRTPGHAVHHVSYIKDDYLFAGETAGVWLNLGATGEYLRPATPPRFYLDTAVDSLERLMDSAPRWLCYGHFGIADEARNRLQMHMEQMLFWEQSISNLMARKKAPDDLAEKCAERLLTQDPLLRHFSALPLPIQKREAYFMRNSIRGFIGWIESKA